MLKITDITKFTLQDYPNKTACIIWLDGCNMQCKYCHNFDIINTKKFLNEDDIYKFLESRVDLLEGVVFSGGEATLSGDNLLVFMRKIKKNLTFKIKIDTNGLNLNFLEKALKEGLLDFVALDFKANENNFKAVTNNDKYGIFLETLQFLIEKYNNNEVNMEVRTTVHTDLLQENNINEIITILEKLNYSGDYFIQNYRDDGEVINMPKQAFLIDKNKIKATEININYRNFF